MRPGRVVLGTMATLAIVVAVLEVILQGMSLIAPAVIRIAAPSRLGPSDVVTILVVGDSHAAGAGVPRDENLPAHLERLLGERHPGKAFRVHNLGLPGVNSPWVANRLERNIRAYDPDLIISWVGANDTWNGTEADAWGYGSWAVAVRRVLLRSRVFRLATVIWHTRGYDSGGREQIMVEAQRHVANPPPIELARGLGLDLERMAETARAYGVPIIFMNYPVTYAVVNETIQKAAKKLRVPVVDALNDVWRARGDGHDPQVLMTHAAGPHPTGLLYRYVAESTVPTVERLLPEVTSQNAPT